MIGAILRRLARYAMPLIGASIFVGLAFPDLAARLRLALEPAVVLLLTTAAMQLDWTGVFTFGRRPRLAILTAGWLLIASPMVVWAGGTALGLAPMLLASMVLNASSAPIISSVPFCQLLSLNAELAVFAVITGTLLLPFTLAPLALALLGIDIAIDPAELVLRTSVFIALPFGLAGLLRRWVRRETRAALRREGDGVTVILMVVIAVAIMDGVAARIVADPPKALAILAAAFSVSVVLHTLGGLAFWRIGAPAGLAMAVTSGSRNLILLFVLLGDAIGADFTLDIALGQVPIYLMPAAIQPLCRLLLRRAGGAGGGAH